MSDRYPPDLDPDLAAGLADLPAERAAALAAAARRFAALDAAQQAALADLFLAETLDNQAEQVAEAALDAAQRGHIPALLPRLDEMAASFAAGHSAASPYADLARFIRCVARLLQGGEPGVSPPGYAQRLACLASALSELQERGP